MSNTKEIILNYLKKHRIDDSKNEILDSFNEHFPVYENMLWPDQVIFQYVRSPSFENDNTINIGNWFALKGASMDGLAIFGGATGRNIAAFKVNRVISALEGTASPYGMDDKVRKMSHPNWQHAIGGSGGMTQIYIPNQLKFGLQRI